MNECHWKWMERTAREDRIAMWKDIAVGFVLIAIVVGGVSYSLYHM